MIFNPFFHDGIISNKCDMGNGFSSLWSGKTLNDVHLEHLEAKVERLNQACKVVSECLGIDDFDYSENLKL